MAMINMYRFGLALKFTGIAVAAVLSTGILVSLAMFYESRHRLREQIIANNEANVTLAAEFVRHYVRSVQESLAFLAKNPVITRATNSEEHRDVAAILREFVSEHAEVNSVNFYDAEGVNRSSGIDSSSVGNRRGDREWFKQVMLTGKPLLGDAGISPTTRRPVVPYAVPVFDQNSAVRGVIRGSISLTTVGATGKDQNSRETPNP
jgi:hypothetical protein